MKANSRLAGKEGDAGAAEEGSLWTGVVGKVKNIFGGSGEKSGATPAPHSAAAHDGTSGTTFESKGHAEPPRWK